VKVYLLVFDTSQATRDEVIKRIDRLQPVVNWQAFFENAICLVSDEEARSLSRLIRADFPKLRFLLSEVDPQSKAGWLPKSIWDFLNNPAPSKTNA